MLQIIISMYPEFRLCPVLTDGGDLINRDGLLLSNHVRNRILCSWWLKGRCDGVGLGDDHGVVLCDWNDNSRSSRLRGVERHRMLNCGVDISGLVDGGEEGSLLLDGGRNFLDDGACASLQKKVSI